MLKGNIGELLDELDRMLEQTDDSEGVKVASRHVSKNFYIDRKDEIEHVRELLKLSNLTLNGPKGSGKTEILKAAVNGPASLTQTIKGAVLNPLGTMVGTGTIKNQVEIIEIDLSSLTKRQIEFMEINESLKSIGLWRLLIYKYSKYLWKFYIPVAAVLWTAWLGLIPPTIAVPGIGWASTFTFLPVLFSLLWIVHAHLYKTMMAGDRLGLCRRVLLTIMKWLHIPVKKKNGPLGASGFTRIVLVSEVNLGAKNEDDIVRLITYLRRIYYKERFVIEGGNALPSSFSEKIGSREILIGANVNNSSLTAFNKTVEFLQGLSNAQVAYPETDAAPSPSWKWEAIAQDLARHKKAVDKLVSNMPYRMVKSFAHDLVLTFNFRNGALNIVDYLAFWTMEYINPDLLPWALVNLRSLSLDGKPSFGEELRKKLNQYAGSSGAYWKIITDDLVVLMEESFADLKKGGKGHDAGEFVRPYTVWDKQYENPYLKKFNIS